MPALSLALLFSALQPWQPPIKSPGASQKEARFCRIPLSEPGIDPAGPVPGFSGRTAMSNLYEILQSAQGGQAIQNLAAQFNLTPEEADAAVRALLPELSERLLKQTSEPAAAGLLASSLADSPFTDPAAAARSASGSREALNEILGPGSAREMILFRASSAAGISPETLSQMLPVIVSMILGGLNKSLENQGLGGILGELAAAAGRGGLGSILGQILGGSEAGPRPESSPAHAGRGFGGLLAAILASLFSRGRTGTSAAPPQAQAPAPEARGLDATSIKATLDALTTMLRPGIPPSVPPQSQASRSAPESIAPSPAGQGQEMPKPADPLADIKAELDRIMGAKRE